MATAFARLRKIQTFYVLLVGVGALGFALFSIPLFLNLFLEDEYGLDAFDRGLVDAAMYVRARGDPDRRGVQRPAVPREPAAVDRPRGRRSSRCSGSSSPPGVHARARRLIIVVGIGTALSQAAFAVLTPVVASVIPYRLRSRATRWSACTCSSSARSSARCSRACSSDSSASGIAMTIVVLPSTLIGGAIIATARATCATTSRWSSRSCSRSARSAARVAAARRRRARAPGPQPRLLLRHGAGALRRRPRRAPRARCWRCSAPTAPASRRCCASSAGSACPTAASCASNGRTITYAEPELRVGIGIVQVPGGKAMFRPLTVRENLRHGRATRSTRRPACRRGSSGCSTLFPMLARAHGRPPAGTCPAASSRCWRWRWRSCSSPSCCSSTSCRSGWRRSWCRSCSSVVERLKDEGMTMVIVEQSLNVALVDRRPRRVHGEGRSPVRGSAPRSCAERDDLVRAVFLGAERWRIRLHGARSAVDIAQPGRCSTASCTGLTYGVLGVGAGPRLPLDQGHQLRVRRDGRLRRRAARPARPRLGLRTTGRARRVGSASARCSARRSSSSSSAGCSPRHGVILLVATLGVAQLLLFAQFVLPRPESVRPLPHAVRHDWEVGGVIVRSQHLVVLVARPAHRRRARVLPRPHAVRHRDPGLGRQPRRRHASPAISIKRMSTLVWVLAGVLATLAAVARRRRSTARSSADRSSRSGPACCCAAWRPRSSAACRRCRSRWSGGVAIGVAEAVLFFNYPERRRCVDRPCSSSCSLLVLFRRGRAAARRGSGAWSFSPRVAPDPGRARAASGGCAGSRSSAACCARARRAAAAGAATTSRRAVPAAAACCSSPSSRLSLTVLTGWAGQLSLGQFAFVGLGAIRTARARPRGHRLPARASCSRPSVGACSPRSSSASPALRVRGLFLAVTTLAFAVADGTWLLTARSSCSTSGSPCVPPRRDRRHRSLALAAHLLLRCASPSWSSCSSVVAAAPTGDRPLASSRCATTSGPRPRSRSRRPGQAHRLRDRPARSPGSPAGCSAACSCSSSRPASRPTSRCRSSRSP